MNSTENNDLESMELRDYVAAKAFATLIRLGHFDVSLASKLARNAYIFADALIEARKVKS